MEANLLNSNLYLHHHSYPETKQCYTDGRYFNAVFEDYAGLCPECLYIDVQSAGKQHYVDRYMKEGMCDQTVPVLIRIITTLKDSNYSHCSLLILKPEKNGIRKAILFDAVEIDSSSKFTESDAVEMVSQLCKVVLEFLSMRIPNLEIKMVLKTLPKPHADCVKSGYCNAQVIMYATAFLMDYDYDPNSVKRFATLLERHYKLCPCKQPEIQYGAVDSRIGGALIGGLAGGVIGGAVAGPTGAVLGGATGAIGGYAVGGLI